MSALSTVILITNIPTPYRIPLFNRLAESLADDGKRLVVLFGAKGYGHRKWDVDLNDASFEYKVLNSIRLPFYKGERAVFTYGGLRRQIRKWEPVAIVTNGFSPATMKLWLMSWFLPCRYIIWSGAIEDDFDQPGKMRELQRRLLIKRATGFISYGTRAKEYLVARGAAPDRVEIGINTVDTQFFHRETDRSAKAEDSGNEVFRMLYVGYVSRRKNVGVLLPVVSALLAQGRKIRLDIVGDGDEREKLESEVERLGIESSVVFHGFKQKQELPKYFSAADCFLFQTDFDIWGLVLVEAMAAGLPCLASVNAGATSDLVMEGETGMAVDYANTGLVVEKLNWLMAHADERLAMGNSAREFIEKNVSIGVSAAGFKRGIDSFGINSAVGKIDQ